MTPVPGTGAEVTVLKGRLMRPVPGKNLPAEDTAQANIQRGVAVGVVLTTARFTEKLMTMTISFFGMTTIVTALAGASWLHFDQAKAVPGGLVVDELPEQVGRPFVNVPALLLSQLAALTNPVEVLESNRRIAGLSGELDNPFGDHVHRVSAEPRLFSALPFQHPPDRPARRLCLLPLETGAGSLVAAADMLQTLAAKEPGPLPVGYDRNVVNAPVYAHDGIVRPVKVGNGLAEGHGQVDLAAPDVQSAITQPPVGQVIGQPGRGLVGDALDPAGAGRNAQPVLAEAEVPAPVATLQADRRVLEPDRLVGGLLELAQGQVLGRDLAVGADQNLGRQPEQPFEVLVRQLVQPGRVADVAILEGDPAGVVTGVVPLLECALSQAKVKIKFQFNRSYDVHEKKCNTLFVDAQISEGGLRAIPRPVTQYLPFWAGETGRPLARYYG